MAIWIFFGIIVVLLAIAYGWYATLVNYRNQAREALSSIDIHLRQRHDLIPNILTIAQKFMNHERELITKIAELRAAATASYQLKDPKAIATQLRTETALTDAVGRLFAVAESNPDLKSQEPIVRAQATFEEVEGHIAAARRFYNAAVAQLNSTIETFPGPLLARLAHAQPLPFYEETDEAIRAPIDANAYLK
ncbi:MAG: LemA family protein [Alphaproteobacteria bacterium]